MDIAGSSNEVRSRSFVLLAAGVLLWGLTLWLVLLISHLSLPGGHSICGAWGCGPPLSALVACHGAWFVILFPVLPLFRRRLAAWESRVGWCMMFAGLAGILGVAAHEVLYWLPAASEWQRQFLLQRWLFSVATWTDVPLLPMTLLGSVLVIRSRTRHYRSSNSA